MAFGAHMRILAMAGVCFAVAAVLPAAAAPLDKEACDKLRAEKQSLTVMGVEKDMAKGADWAKANMKPAQLDLVKRYIAVDEQLKFRCHTAVAEAKAAAKAARAVAAKGAKQVKAAPPAAAEDKTAQPAENASSQAKSKTAPGAGTPEENEQD